VAGEEKTTRNLPIKTSAKASDRVVFVSNAASDTSNTATIAISDLFLNTDNVTANLVGLRVISPLGTPANSAALNVDSGVIWSDGTYLYYTTSNNHVKRVLGSDF
jgi:hypothetical protein